VIGCFCKEGYLKNEKGECVRPQECDGQTHHKLNMQIPSVGSFPTCPDNEEFQACGSACAPDCANPNPSPVCTKNCVIGCFCKQGHLRNSQSVCVPADKCDAKENTMLFAYPPEMSQCKENEIFLRCGSACAPTCANPQPGPACTLQCVVGCFCKPGYLKNEQGVCVPSVQCGVPAASAMPFVPHKCEENEEYRQCKGCDGTCDKPNPICPRICIPGCACKKGHLRTGANGKCIPTEQCPKVASLMMMPPVPKCASDREMYSVECGTQLDCMATCHTPFPYLIHGVPQIPKKCLETKCAPACFCQFPYVRNTDGKCVERQECDPVATTPSH
jgi:hypothetical protein